MMKKILAIWCLAFLGLHSICQAGVLNGHVAAYGGVAGSTPFNNGAGLSGTVDYAVFTAADFSANFGGLGYVPSGPMVYAYQIENTGSQNIFRETITLSNPASAIGTFAIGDVGAASAALTPDAEWTFAPALAPGESSWGLAFSSPNIPIVGFSTIDGADTFWLFAGVPVPGNIAVPEPGSATILALGAMSLLLWRRAGGRRSPSRRRE